MNIRHQSDLTKVFLYLSPSFLSKWLFQPWLQLWISRSSLVGRYIRSENCITIWTGSQTSGRTRSWFLSPSRKASPKTSSLPPSAHGSSRSTVILCYELSDQEALTLHQVKAYHIRAFAASKAFQSGVSFEKNLISLPLEVT